MTATMTSRDRCIWAAALTASLAGCGGGSDSGPAPAPPVAPTPPAIVLPPLIGDASVRVSGDTPFAANCTGGALGGTEYRNAEVEPYAAVNPTNAANIVAVWQQDRWSTGLSNGLVGAVTFDGGATWTTTTAPFTRCGGGNAANGGDYERATDPWVTFAPNGNVFQMALATQGASMAPGSVSAMLVSRSTDSGRTWSNPSTLIRDGASFFNDKNTITADPIDSNYVYAVWDRLAASGGGPTFFARTTDGGNTWEGARSIFDPGPGSQTIGNVIVVHPNGTLINLFTQLNEAAGGQITSSLNIVRSSDKGGSWSTPIRIADVLAIGARDPETGTLVRDGAGLGQIAVAPNGNLFVIWQDARFSSGARDGIVLSRSIDGGSTWSIPVQINSAPATQAFTPNVHVRANGTIGVTYYDFRSNTPDPTTLPTELIFSRSTDGVTWQENRLGAAFDMFTAPFSRGLFIGDYHALTSANNVFIPVYVRTNSGDATNRTDVFAIPMRSLPLAAVLATSTFRAQASPAAAPDAEFRQRVHDNSVRTMEQRIPGWSRRLRGHAPIPSR
ncbi:MAG TPA: sialidase family protein [Burkholderiaceae bacterium]|nr:sialidase family protein [Burkholderiaceae bacterium]